MTEQIMTDRERTALQLSRVTRLLEKAWPLIEEEAERRDAAMRMHGALYNADSYWPEMRELADEVSAEIHTATEGER